MTYIIRKKACLKGDWPKPNSQKASESEEYQSCFSNPAFSRSLPFEEVGHRLLWISNLDTQNKTLYAGKQQAGEVTSVCTEQLRGQ